MNKLPEGWVRVDLGEVCTQGGQRIPSAKERFAYIDIASVDRNRKVISAPQALVGAEAPSRARKVVATGDVLVSMTRPNLNAVALVGELHDAAIASTGFEVLRTCDVEPRWIFAAVRSIHFVDSMSAKVQGALYPAIKSDDIRSYEIPLPPLEEQKRIAQKLDALLAQVDTLKARIDAIPALIKRLRQAVRATALAGELIPNDQVDRSGWRDLVLAEIAAIETGKTPSRSESGYWEGGSIPWVTSSATGESVCNKAKEFVTPRAVRECSLKLFSPGTLLLAMYGEGKTRGQVTELTIQAACNQACAAISINEESALRSFVKLRLEENYEEIRKLASGGNQPNLNLGTVANLRISLPTKGEQLEIIGRVERLFSFADQLETKAATAKQRIDALTQSLLAKAFRGELVPQDPNDEPASELLARIRAQRADAPKPKRGRKANT